MDLQQIVLPVLFILVRFEVPKVPFVLQRMLGDERVLAVAGVLLADFRINILYFLFGFGRAEWRLVNKFDRVT